MTLHAQAPPEYDIASLYMVSVYCFVTKACTRRSGTTASQAFKRMRNNTACTARTCPAASAASTQL